MYMLPHHLALVHVEMGLNTQFDRCHILSRYQPLTESLPWYCDQVEGGSTIPSRNRLLQLNPLR